MTATFKAAVIREAGPAEVLKIEQLPIPKPKAGQVLIRIKAFGLNRSELFTRQGHSPGVHFPRVLGIECVGLVEEAPGNEFSKGQTVATAMGGIGRQFDGGYAEFTCAPASQVSTFAQVVHGPVGSGKRRVEVLFFKRSTARLFCLDLQKSVAECTRHIQTSSLSIKSSFELHEQLPETT